MKLKLKWAQAAYWAFPGLLALALYWPGLTAWFQKDDFAWLGLRDLVHSPRDLGWALFAPLAQGTIRTLSERAFFLSFTSVFGLQALPFRVWVFLTGFVTLVLLAAVATRLTRSRAVGLWAAIFWIVNSTTAFVFSWTAIYYELLCALFFLAGLWLLIRYAESGEKRFYWAQWGTYLVGFLVLELNVVYPAIALAYALCCAPSVWRKTIPLFLPALAYTVLHLVTAPLQRSGPYRMYWDASILKTLWVYWKSVLGPNRLIYLGIQPSVVRSLLAVALMAGLFGFLVWATARREWLALFFASWFLIVILPVLPLRDHATDYYLTIPMLGLAMWASQGVVTAWRIGGVTRGIGVALAVIYLGVNIPVARISSQAFHDNSQRIRRLVEGVVAATATQPERVIVLRGIDNPELFWDFLWNRPFRLYHRDEVYLISEEAPAIRALLDAEAAPRFFISELEARTAARENRAVVIDVTRDIVRDVTDGFR